MQGTQLTDCLPEGSCSPHPLLFASFNQNGRGAISGFLGREEEEEQADEVPRIIQERARGLEKGGRAGMKGKHNPFIMMPGPVLTQLPLGAVEEIEALVSWEAR